jgi:hypothetical protein
MDGTLFHTEGSTYIVHTDGTRSKAPAGKRQLLPGERLDYSEWTSAQKFAESATPIEQVLLRLQLCVEAQRKEPYCGDTIILTARGDLDDQSLFAKILLQNGIDIERDVHVYRSGNFGGSVTANKIRVLSSFVDWRVYTQYRIFEDDKGNLEAFKEYFEPLPVHYEGYLIHPNGAITLYR